MRFRAEISHVQTFSKLIGSFATLGTIAWLRLDERDVRITVIPEQGSQVWSVIAIDTIFDAYTIQSAANGNMINLEVSLAPLQRALKSATAQNAISASIRLTKKDSVPLLSLTIKAQTANNHDNITQSTPFSSNDHDSIREQSIDLQSVRPDRETVVTQDIPVRVLAPATVEGLHEPRCRDPDVHITLPNLFQLKNISDRFTRLSLTSNRGARASAASPKLELSANMHGCLRLALDTDAMRINSLWTGLENPELDPAQVPEGEEGLANHPSTRMKNLGDATGHHAEGWATVRLDGRDWGRVLSVGRLGGKVIACFCHDHALIMYVFLNSDEPVVGESVLTYYISSYSA